MEKNNLEILKNDLKKDLLFYNMENKNNFNSENNNLSINTMDNIIEILKRKIDKQINTFVQVKTLSIIGISTFCQSQAVPGYNLGVLTRLLYFFCNQRELKTHTIRSWVR